MNLPEHSGRLGAFYAGVPADWPFRRVERFEATNGCHEASPPGWHKPAGAYGNRASHRRIWATMIERCWQNVMVLEDDALFAEGFGPSAVRFLSAAPQGWEILMFGGVHMRPPVDVGGGVCRCRSACRTHAYAINQKGAEGLLRESDDGLKSCSELMLAATQRLAAYAPGDWLVGQRAGASTIWKARAAGDRFFRRESRLVAPSFNQRLRECHSCEHAAVRGVELHCGLAGAGAVDLARQCLCPAGRFTGPAQPGQTGAVQGGGEPGGTK